MFASKPLPHYRGADYTATLSHMFQVHVKRMQLANRAWTMSQVIRDGRSGRLLVTEGLPCQFENGIKRGGIMDGRLAEHFAIEHDVGEP